MPRVELSRLLENKVRIRAELSSKLTRKERREALEDGHAHREPRPCGLTIHPGRGCSYGCLYCYIEDMGIPREPELPNLNGLQLAYAIASNPYTLVGNNGTFLAFGSVTEPFLPRIREKTIEYLEAVRKYLGNPSQFSTKAYLSEEDVKVVAAADPSVSALVTVPALEWAKRLEPYAPSPELRFKTIENLLSAGLHVSLFLRPLIPGITEDEGPKILRRVADLGARGVVLGALRVTRSILEKLESIGLKDLEARMTRKPRDAKDQVPLNTGDLKRMLSSMARELGLRIFPSACSANVNAHGLGCHMCEMGPCDGPLPEYDPEEIEQSLEGLGIEARILPKGTSIIVYVRGGSKRAKRVKHLVSTATRRRVIVRTARS
ncbi:MAG: radical SAM protein [Candidatus Korarchaeota archaeon]|nr:radical SAM protein [Candidatus Korarchaeota archaeon]